jgi:hypothetical protein
MTTTHTRTKFAVVVGAAIAGAAAPALLFLGAGTAHAVQDVSERGGFAILDDLPTPRTCPGCGESDAQSDPGNPDPGSRVGISDPEDKVGLGGPDTLPPVMIFGPGSKVRLGGPDTMPPIMAAP